MKLLPILLLALLGFICACTAPQRPDRALLEPVSTAAPVQWLLAVFPATVAARGSADYTLVTDGSAGPNPPPPVPLRLARLHVAGALSAGAAPPPRPEKPVATKP